MALVERLAATASEEGVSVADAGLGGAVVDALPGPAGLGDPDPLALADVARVRDALPEDVPRVVDAGVLEVGVAVHAEEVDGLDDGGVGRVDPCGPGVDVRDLFVRCSETPQHAADVTDLRGEGVGVGVFSVEIFGADGDSDEPVLAIGLDGGQEGLLLSLVVCVVFSPDADEKLGVCGEGRGDSIGKRAAVRSRVEAGSCEASWESVHGNEIGLPVSLSFAATVCIVGLDIEALPVGRDGGREQGS